MTSENKSVSAILVVAVCALSLAVHGATDNEWVVYTGDDASTDFNFAKNWSPEGKTGDGSFFYRNGTGVKNSSIGVTFAGAYTLPGTLKFENNDNGNGLIKFTADDEDYGVAVTGSWELGWQNSLANLLLARGAYYGTDKLYFRGGNLAIEAGASLSVTNESSISVDGGNGRDATLNINGGAFSVLNANLNVGYCDNQVGSLVITNGNVDVRYQIQVAKSNNSVGIFAISNGTVNCGSLFQVGLNGHGEFYMEDGTINCSESFRMATDRADATATGVMNGGRITTEKNNNDEYGIMIGNAGSAAFTMNGGEISPAKSFIVGRSGTGRFEMNGGTITTTTSGETWIGGSQNNNNYKGTGVFVMNDGLVDLHNWISVGRTGTGRLELYGGTFQIVNNGLEIARYGNSTGTVVVAGGTLDYKGNQYLAVGFDGDYGELIVSNGLANSTREVHIAKGGGKEGRVVVEGGRFNTSTHVYVGHSGTGSFYMNGGEAYIGNQFWLGNGGSSYGLFVMTNGEMTVSSYTCVGYNSGIGRFVMNGGSYYQNSEKFIIGQNNSDTAYGECIVSNGTINVPNLWIAENTKRGTLTMEGGEFISRGETQLSRNANAGKGTINLNGGTLSVNYFSSSSGTGGEIIFNGGTLAARASRTDFIPDIANLKLSIAEGGAVIDTVGNDVTIADTFDNADGLVGNGMIAKKGLGTLTISSDLDLERTFKFTIDQGVGPIALTSESNTLASGKKISVEINPVDVEIDTPYTLMTGLADSYTIADNFTLPTDDGGLYTYAWTLADGALSLTIGLSATAPAYARYDSDTQTWKTYNPANELLPEATVQDYTSYVFNGSEPTEDFVAFTATHRVVLETGTINITSPIACSRVTIPAGASVTLSGNGAASFSATDLRNNGTLTFAGTIAVDSLEAVGNVVIAEDAVVTLARPQKIYSSLFGTGTLVLSGEGRYNYNRPGDDETVMDGFAGTLKLCGTTFKTEFSSRGGTKKYGKFIILLGSAKIVMAGSTLEFADNEAYCSADIEFESGTENHVVGDNTAICLDGTITGSGSFTISSSDRRGGRLRGDFFGFNGTCTIETKAWREARGAEGFHSVKAGSSTASWVFPANEIADATNDRTYYIGAGNNKKLELGEFRQTGPVAKSWINDTGMTLEIGGRSGGESVIEGQFTHNAVTLSKVGADSYLTLGTNFGMVASSTLTVSAGGLAFNLPTDDTVTDLTGDTVTIDPSVKIRVAMTQAQYDDLDLNEEYLVAKLPTNPGYKPETELLVDGTVLDTPAAAKWGVRFKSFPAVGDTPAYVGAVLCRRSAGFMIIVY